MKFGYLRVSTKEQNEARQIAELIKYVDIQNIFIDKASGRNLDRPNYLLLKEKLRAGDEIYFKELDRLGRNKNQVKEELEFFRKNNIIVRFLDIPTTLMTFDSFGDMQNTLMEMINSILIEVFTTLADTEYKKIKQRQIEGIKIAKDKGKYTNCGRPKKQLEDRNFIFLYNQYKDNKIKATDFAKMMNCSRTTLYKKIKDYETLNFKNRRKNEEKIN